MKEYVLEIHDDRERFVRVAFKDKALRDGIYRAVMEHAVNVDFVDTDDLDTRTLKEKARVRG